MLRATFKTFVSGSGDCMVLCLSKGDSTYTIFIDCGVFTQEIENYVRNTLHSHIDLLIVTHIDNDHISGVSTMLSKIPNLQIDRIIFNSYNRTNEDGSIANIEENLIKRVNALKKCLPLVVNQEEEQIKANHALLLSECILSKETWTNAWEQTYCSVNSPNIPLANGELGELIILSPKIQDLKKLEDKYEKEYNKMMYSSQTSKTKEDKILFELLLRLYNANPDNIDSQVPVSFGKMSKELIDSKAKDEKQTITDENRASLALLWKYGNRGILLLGDSDPSTVEAKLSTLGDIKIDACKISHHGSKHNTTISLIKLVGAPHYFITGGKNEERPSIETIAKIIKYNKSDSTSLHINYSCSQLSEIKKITKFYPEIVVDCTDNQIELEYE